jgi:hypothetical protein
VNPITIGMVVFAFALGAVLVGSWLSTRLPEDHLKSDSKDAVRLGIGLVATMTALVLGLVTASAKSTFDAVEKAVKSIATEVLTLDRQLARYGPETEEIRLGLKQAIATRIDVLSEQSPSQSAYLDPINSGAASGVEKLVDRIRSLTPRNDLQRSLKSRALDLAETLLQSRWQIFVVGGSSVPLPFLVVLLFWLTITFASFGLVAPRNATVLALYSVCALSVGLAVFLILEMDGPFDGLIRVSVEPLRYVNAHLIQ